MKVHSLVQSRQQVIEHIKSNRQRTDPQKTEIQQRRNNLARRIKIWRVAQAVYMPQISAYLSDDDVLPTSDEDGLSVPNDVPKLDDLKAETWPLFLPSAIPEDDRSPCHRGVIETERVLRLAQLQDSLEDLRRFRRALRNLKLYFKKNTAGEGQKTQTKSRAVEMAVNGRIKRSVTRYRIAYLALSELDLTGDWRNEYRELQDEDNRGPLKEDDEIGTGDGRYIPSWIWASPSAMTLPGEGTIVEQHEVNETARHEWMTCRARADRWMEEEELLQEEMRRVITYLLWKSRTWSEKVGVRVGSCTPDIQHGVDAYAHKQASIHRGLAISFASKWLPYLHAWGFSTKWATKLPWVSKVPLDAKLPKQFSVPEAAVPTPSTVDSPPSTEGPKEGQGGPNVCQTQPEDDDSEGEERHDEYANHKGTGHSEGELCSDDGAQESDDEEQESDDEGEGYGEEEDFDDDGLGFEYDDEYMA